MERPDSKQKKRKIKQTFMEEYVFNGWKTGQCGSKIGLWNVS